MKAKIGIKPCPFCGSEVTAMKGMGNITFFKCLNAHCGAIVSFEGGKVVSNTAAEAVNPLENWSRRVSDNG